MLKRDKKEEFLEVGIVSMKYQFTSEKNMQNLTPQIRQSLRFNP